MVLQPIDRPAFLAEGTAVISRFRFVFTSLIRRVLFFTLLCF